MIKGELHLRGIVVAFVSAAMLSAALLIPGSARADLSATVFPCIWKPNYCASIDSIQPNTPFAISMRVTPGQSLSAGDRIYVKGPDGTHFSGVRQWRFTVGLHSYEQRGSDFDVFDDGRIIRAKIFDTLYPPLGAGQTAIVEFGEVQNMVSVDPIGSFRVAVWSNVEDTPVMTNAIKVDDAPPATFRELKTRIKSGPSGKTRAARVVFRFTSKGSKNFVCRIDSRRWRSCKSPKRYRVAEGRHTFRVRAVGNDGKLGKIVKRTFRRV